MEELLNEYVLKHLAASIVVVSASLLAMGYIIVKVSKIHYRIKNLPCTAHEKHIERHNDKIDALASLNAKVDGILDAIQSLNIGNSPKLIKSHSPVNITETGREYADELGIEAYIDQNWKAICAKIKSKVLTNNPYDIQQYCFNYTFAKPEEVVTPIGHDKIKSKAFSLGMPVINLLQVVAILVRNRYFEENNMNIEEIDKHDPNKQES